MQNFIGHIHDTIKHSNAQIEKTKKTIKEILHLHSVDMKRNDAGAILTTAGIKSKEKNTANRRLAQCWVKWLI